VPASASWYVAGVAFVSRTSVAVRSVAPGWGTKPTQSLHVSPPGSAVPHVDPPMKKSPADGPVNVALPTVNAFAPIFLSVISCDALAVPCAWEANVRLATPTRPTG
jgi:hypothetical protein